MKLQHRLVQLLYQWSMSLFYVVIDNGSKYTVFPHAKDERLARLSYKGKKACYPS